MSRSPSRTTVLTAPMERASSDSAASSGTTCCLEEWVTLKPSNPIRRTACGRPGSPASSRPLPSGSISRQCT